MYTALRIHRCKGPHLANDCNPDIEIEGRYPLRLRVVHFLSVSFSAVKVCLSERKTLVDAYSCQSISTVCLSRRVRYRIDCRERIRITSGNHVFASSRFPVPFLHGGHHKCPIKKDNRTKRIIDFQFQHALGSGVEWLQSLDPFTAFFFFSHLPPICVVDGKVFDSIFCPPELPE